MRRLTYNEVLENIDQMKADFAKENKCKTDGSDRAYNNYCEQLDKYVSENPTKTDLIQW